MADCSSCYFLTMSRVSEEHVIDTHFRFEDWANIDLRQSFFFSNIISPQQLFYIVQNIPRWLLGQIGWSYGGRFMYTIPFDYNVGVYPAQGCTTNTIAIICECFQCSGCGIHVPTDIVTIYPWDKHCAEYGRYWRTPAIRKRKLWTKIRLSSNIFQYSTRQPFSQCNIVVVSPLCIFLFMPTLLVRILLLK